MAKAEKKIPEQEAPEEVLEQEAPESEPAAGAASEPAELESLKDTIAQQEEKYLRLAAEYDNYRKRSAKEKESAWTDAKADTAAAFLPVYDNLERALKAPCSDEAFLKGVEMTMAELEKIFQGLGVSAYGQAGDAFDPNLHNAVMHTQDESQGENVITQVFLKGFRMGERVIRFAMVQVAN